jgi:hypothetical protein
MENPGNKTAENAWNGTRLHANRDTQLEREGQLPQQGQVHLSDKPKHNRVVVRGALLDVGGVHVDGSRSGTHADSHLYMFPRVEEPGFGDSGFLLGALVACEQLHS